MPLVNLLSRILELVLEVFAAILMVSLTAIVVYAVVTRWMGSSPSWYDEVAAIALVWLTYYAGALAALKRGHIGFDGLIMALPPALRMAAAVVAEVFVIGFFAILAWTGLQVLQILGGMSLVSLTWVPVKLTQSVIPIGAALFILAELLSMPAHFARVRAGISEEHIEIEQAIAEAREEFGEDGEKILAGDTGRGRS